MKPKKPIPSEFYQRPMYTGEKWDNVMQRPGCKDFLAHPSRTGDRLTEYKPPICNSSKIKVK